MPGAPGPSTDPGQPGLIKYVWWRSSECGLTPKWTLWACPLRLSECEDLRCSDLLAAGGYSLSFIDGDGAAGSKVKGHCDLCAAFRRLRDVLEKETYSSFLGKGSRTCLIHALIPWWACFPLGFPKTPREKCSK